MAWGKASRVASILSQLAASSFDLGYTCAALLFVRRARPTTVVDPGFHKRLDLSVYLLGALLVVLERLGIQPLLSWCIPIPIGTTQTADTRAAPVQSLIGAANPFKNLNDFGEVGSRIECRWR